MKVLYITHYSRFYGANRSLLQLILHLRQNFGVEALVIAPEEGMFTEELNKNKISFEIYKYFNWLTPRGHFLKATTKHILNFFFFYSIRKALDRHKGSIDLVHTNSSATNLGGSLAKKLKLPHIWHIREYGDKDYDLTYTFGIHMAAKFFIENASVIITISKDLKEHYSRYIAPDKITVVYNGVKIPADLKKKYNHGSILNLSFIGVISEGKNQWEALRACEHLVNEIGVTNFVLNFVGEGETEYIDLMKKYIGDHGLNSQVKFAGYLPNIEKHLEKIDIGIVSSKSEAFGRVTVEYMMHKIPVIASNSGANPELIEHDRSGYLYELGNHKDLASCIHKLSLDKGKLKKMGDYACEYASNEYSSIKNAENIYAIYQEALQGQG